MDTKAAILVTGGAGYIGSHVAKSLAQAGYPVVVLDNLSTGFKSAAEQHIFIEGDVGDQDLVSEIFSRYPIDTVMHFAAHTVVPESLQHPAKYYDNNLLKSMKLLECCVNASIKRFVFSSTAAVYGAVTENKVAETSPTAPIHPYGFSKLMFEQVLQDVAAVNNLNYCILRYFNVAGASPDGTLGQSTLNASHLFKVIVEVLTGKRDALPLFGDDHNTPDGTCIRDYIHVTDLANAHLAALNYLEKHACNDIFNCGYGHGYSVKEVIDIASKMSSSPLPVTPMPKRDGDPACVIADNTKIQKVLGWTPEHDDLSVILKSALDWERGL